MNLLNYSSLKCTSPFCSFCKFSNWVPGLIWRIILQINYTSLEIDLGKLACKGVKIYSSWEKHNKIIPSRQSFRKSNVEECIFDYIASHIECRFNKNSLLQCYFLAILPAGLSFTSFHFPASIRPQKDVVTHRFNVVSTSINVVLTSYTSWIRFYKCYQAYQNRIPVGTGRQDDVLTMLF